MMMLAKCFCGRVYEINLTVNHKERGNNVYSQIVAPIAYGCEKCDPKPYEDYAELYRQWSIQQNEEAKARVANVEPKGA